MSRIKRRSAVIFALAAAGALAVAGIALASGTSTVSFKFSPSNVPKTTFQKGKINIHTHTNYTGATQTDRARLFFDDDFKINTGAAPKCKESKISGKNMKDAMAACGSSLIGTGTAAASGGIGACVLVFNGTGSGGHILLHTRASFAGPFSCANPSNNTKGDVSVVLNGALKSNPASLGGDFSGGKQLDFNHITGVSPFPLTDFNVTVQKGNFFSARCHDSNHKWNLQTKFTYVSPASTQTVKSSQTCS
jgi:hypothetical protein